MDSTGPIYPKKVDQLCRSRVRVSDDEYLKWDPSFLVVELIRLLFIKSNYS